MLTLDNVNVYYGGIHALRDVVAACRRA
jgi:ABC-type branched-subunit amino acid transport system ATPase component